MNDPFPLIFVLIGICTDAAPDAGPTVVPVGVNGKTSRGGPMGIRMGDSAFGPKTAGGGFGG